MADTTATPGQTAARTPPSSKPAEQRELRDRLGVRPKRPKGQPQRPALSARLLDALWTLLWVIPLTILLWLYAEREQIAPVSDVPVPFELRTSSADRVVALISPEDRRVYVDLKGPRASLDFVREGFGDGKLGPVDVYVPDDLPPGSHDLSLTDRLARNEVFRERAIEITRSRPSVRIRIERRIAQALPVKVRPEENFVGTAIFEPEMVTVEGPESLFKATPVDRLVVYADLSKFAREKPGKYEGDVPLLFTTPVPYPFRAEQVALPKTVKVKVDLQRSQQDTLASIPLVVQMPARILEADRYKVQAPVTVLNVNVAGPPETIQQLKAAKLTGQAVLEMTADDFAPSAEPVQRVKKLRPENYRMPKDVTVVDPEREVTVTVVDRGG